MATRRGPRLIDEHGFEDGVTVTLDVAPPGWAEPE